MVVMVGSVSVSVVTSVMDYSGSASIVTVVLFCSEADWIEALGPHPHFFLRETLLASAESAVTPVLWLYILLWFQGGLDLSR